MSEHAKSFAEDFLSEGEPAKPRSLERLVRLRKAVKAMDRLGRVKTSWRNKSLANDKRKARAKVISLARELFSGA